MQNANRNTAMKFQISAIPTIMLFKNGEVVTQFVGLYIDHDRAEGRQLMGGCVAQHITREIDSRFGSVSKNTPCISPK